MFSGKTTELVRRVRRYQAASKLCLLLNYKGDARYAEAGNVVTHDLTQLKAHPVETLEEAHNRVWQYDVIAVDEGQFMPDLVEWAERWANEGKLVLVAALDGTFKRQPFLPVLQLVSLAEDVTKLKAVCAQCHREAAFTHRKSPEDAVELVGGRDKYEALCRACHAQSSTEMALSSINLNSPSAVSCMHPPVKRKSTRISNARRASLPEAGRENRSKIISNPSILQSPSRRRRSLQAVTIR
ncbi:hypothetical protein WJX84_008264 [Apatococcus fuscideae]